MAFTASLQQAAESVVGKVKTADRRVVIAAASAAALTVAWYATKFVLSASNSERHLNDDQKALLAPRRVRVSDSREVAIEAIKLTPSSLGPAADCLAAKNADDPMMVACGAEDFEREKRERSLRWLYRVLLRSSVPIAAGAIPLQTEGSKAVAVWFSKGHQLSLLQVGLSGGWQYLWRYSGFDRRGRFPGYSQVINAYRDRLVGKEGHQGAYFYLLTYARRPELTATEGAAQLTAVVKPVLERADVLGQPCYMEVTNAEDVAFFEGLGFRRADAFPLYSANIVSLIRSPKAAAGAAGHA